MPGESLIAGPSKSGGAWFWRKTTPHKNAVNQSDVNVFGWYLRTTMACGTGNNPTMVVERMNPSIASSSKE